MVRISRVMLKEAGNAIDKTLSEILVCPLSKQPLRFGSVRFASAEACNELMAYSLILSCCCYTCCVRRKLRKTLNITGGYIDDFLSHLMCCCCALVQELREVEIRGAYGTEKTKVSPPPSQFMEH
ncbi:hypothetical protein F2Q69_00057936 [Brassica cretica]|uniref:Uncharacterized protein n=1 Tax=Brassica cretica TaxID=69181 RepID=A0A8S9N312_BRACR|nr:hypothetical protein F2Q69_00057936 [Brassica cretica]